MRNEFEQPTSIEAEKAVLGGVLLEPELWDSVAVLIEEDDFALTEHRLCLLYTSPSPRDRG